MLLDRLHRPVKGVRLVRREQPGPGASFRIQILPLRLLQVADIERIKESVADIDGPIVTAALANREQEPFLAAGFTPKESLYLLRHDLQTISAASGADKIRNARRSDLERVLEIDRQGFDDFWTFDKQALAAARRATPNHRYVVATRGQHVIGYAISGQAGSTGYLQRLGVAKDFQRQGVGGQLITDALQWTARAGATSTLVNTQEVNEAARRVYEQHGFVVDDQRLTVLEWLR